MKKTLSKTLICCLLAGGLYAQTANEGSTFDKSVNTGAPPSIAGNCTLKAGSSSICEDAASACKKNETWLILCKAAPPGNQCESKTFPVSIADGYCANAQSGQCGACQFGANGP